MYSYPADIIIRQLGNIFRTTLLYTSKGMRVRMRMSTCAWVHTWMLAYLKTLIQCCSSRSIYIEQRTVFVLEYTVTFILRRALIITLPILMIIVYRLTYPSDSLCQRIHQRRYNRSVCCMPGTSHHSDTLRLCNDLQLWERVTRHWKTGTILKFHSQFY